VGCRKIISGGGVAHKTFHLNAFILFFCVLMQFVWFCLLSLGSLAVAAGCPSSYSNITWSQLRRLDPFCLRSATSQNVQEISASPDLCSFMTYEVISNLSSSYEDSCTGFSASCLRQLSPAAVAGFTGNCVVQFTQSALLALNSSQVAALNPTVFQSFGESFLALLDSHFCSYLSSSQVTVIGADQYLCSSLSVDCVSNFKAEALSGLTRRCFGSLSLVSLAALSVEQVKSIPPADFQELTAQSAGALGPVQCSALNSQQFGYFDVRYFADHVCSGLTGTCVSAIPDRAFNSISQFCLNALTGAAISNLTGLQMQSIPDHLASVFSHAQLSALSPMACSGISAAQVSYISPYACPGLGASCVNSIPPASFSNISSGCVQVMTSEAVGGLTAAQIASFPVESVVFSATQFTSLQGNSCKGFSREQVAFISTVRLVLDACSGMKSECMENLAPEKLINMSFFCGIRLSSEVMSILTPAQLSKIPVDNIAEMFGSQFQAIQPDTCSGFTFEQMGNMASSPSNQDACSRLSASCVSKIPAESFGGISVQCILSLKDAAMSSVTSEMWSKVPSEVFSLLSSNEISLVNAISCSGFVPEQLALLNHSCSGFSVNCLNNITSQGLATFGAECVSQWSNETLSGLAEDSLLSLSAVGISGLTALSFVTILLARGNGIIDRFSREQMRLVKSIVKNQFHSFWQTGLIREDSERDVLGTDGKLASKHWLQVSLSSNHSASSLQVHHFGEVSQDIGCMSGLRMGHASFMSANVFSGLPHLSGFSYDFISNLTATQIGDVPCESFQDFEDFPYMCKSGVLQFVSPLQFDGAGSMISNWTVDSFPCSCLQTLTTPQRRVIVDYNTAFGAEFSSCPTSPDVQTVFHDSDLGKCTLVTSPPVLPPSTSTTAPSQEISKKQHVVIPIVLSTVLLFVLFVGFVVYRRRRQRAYVLLPSIDPMN
jgi:hypothetical protein